MGLMTLASTGSGSGSSTRTTAGTTGTWSAQVTPNGSHHGRLSEGVGLTAFTSTCVYGGFWFVGSSYLAGAAVLGSTVVTCSSPVFW